MLSPYLNAPAASMFDTQQQVGEGTADFQTENSRDIFACAGDTVPSLRVPNTLWQSGFIRPFLGVACGELHSALSCESAHCSGRDAPSFES